MQFPNREAELYTSIGSIYFYWKEFKNAIENYEMAYNIYLTIDHLPSVANLCYLKGYTLYKIKNYDESEMWFRKGLEINKTIHNKNEVAKIYDALGQLYYDKKTFAQALIFYKKAHKIHKQMGDKIILAQSLNNIGNVYKELGNFNAASNSYKQSLKIAIDLDLKLTQMDNYKSFYELYYFKNSSKKALMFYQKFVALRDSIFNKNSTAASGKYIINEELLQAKKELTQKNRLFIYTLVISIAIIIILIIMLLLQRAKIRKPS